MTLPAESTASRRRLWSRDDAASTIGVARRVAEELKDGLSGPGVRDRKSVV